jgi:two-component system NtrC family sensor kinase
MAGVHRPADPAGGAIYYQFGKLYKERIEDQIRHLARSQSNAVDVFLRERTTILAMIVEPNPSNP